MLNRTNIIALVGGGKRERFPKNQVIIWDDHQNKPLSDLNLIHLFEMLNYEKISKINIYNKKKNIYI